MYEYIIFPFINRYEIHMFLLFPEVQCNMYML